MRFIIPIPTTIKYLLTKVMPNKTDVYSTLKTKPGAERRDLNKLGISQENIQKYADELRGDREFCGYFTAKMSSATDIEPKMGGVPSMHILEFIYAIIREYKPDVLVETGVGAGGTSMFILKALQANNKGKLYSIDLPGFDQYFYPRIGKGYNIHVPDGWDPGWLVPSELRSRWVLTLGDSKLELPILLNKLRGMDFFLHDSLHTYEHMMFEYCLAYMYLHDGAFLMSDDVTVWWTFAFIDFCNAMNLPFALVDGSLGITQIRKQG